MRNLTGSGEEINIKDNNLTGDNSQAYQWPESNHNCRGADLAGIVGSGDSYYTDEVNENENATLMNEDTQANLAVFVKNCSESPEKSSEATGEDGGASIEGKNEGASISVKDSASIEGLGSKGEAHRSKHIRSQQTAKSGKRKSDMTKSGKKKSDMAKSGGRNRASESS